MCRADIWAPALVEKNEILESLNDLLENRAGVRLERKEPWTSVDTEGHALQRSEAEDDAPTN